VAAQAALEPLSIISEPNQQIEPGDLSPLSLQGLPCHIGAASRLIRKETGTPSCKRQKHNFMAEHDRFDSLRLDPELLHSRPPFCSVSPLQGGERLGGLLLAGKNFKREVD